MMTHRALLLALLLATPAAADDWTVIDTSDGITTLRKEVAGSTMMAFRGEAEVPVHVSRLAGVLLDSDMGPTWVDMQVASGDVERISPYESVIYNQYDLSWPISDRDYVMRRVATFNEEGRVVTATYHSVEHASKPESDCCVRAQALRTYWRFTALGGDRTKVEVEVHTDPKGMLPAWVVNMVQKGWPSNSITGLAKRAAETDVVPRTEALGW